MRIDKQRISAFLKSLPLPLLIGVPLLLLLLFFWSVQQNNVDSLAQQIIDFKKQIEALPITNSSVSKDKQLALEKDRLTLEKDRVNAQNAIYGTLGQAVGGVFFFVTAYLTWRNVKATEEKQVTERFSKAVELLGSEKLEVRLGGIYALERIAKDSPKDHWTIMEVLTSFVREKSHKRHIPNLKITLDIQSALIVIGRRDSSKDPEYRSLDLSDTNLSRANLCRSELLGANLEHAYLIRADLSQSNLAQANLRKANLLNTDLHEAILTYADFSMSLNLTPEQVKSAQGWEQATYDEDFRKELGLPKKSGDGRQNG